MNDDLRHQATRLANDAEKYLKAMHKDKCDPDSWYSIRAETAIAGVRRALAKAPATVSEGEEQGFGAPATKERPSSPSLERVAVLEEALTKALRLKGGWREAIVELEDFCSEPVRLRNMIAAADQLDEWAASTRVVLAGGNING